ncbi:MAG: ABC transporter substrate-binding protein [Brasilonema octagenarum HA4186-MV1]|jgi:ABC-type branched-subunit amino acid transport system substrate-binding protein|nr:ABC transporter substrate-binding protein [Brasilonema octagenarum HA4186-MV1]
MPYCINPECQSRDNPDNVNACQHCGNHLLINNRYRLITQLSNNYYTCTQVFEVEDSQNLGTRKILKAIHNNGIRLPDGREFFTDLIRLFRREQSILIHLEHPGIPRGEAYFSLLLNNGQELHCLVMEKIEGQNLEQWLGEHGAIDERQALEWLKQLATILDFIHQQNWFHRDIKPSNIMRRPNGQLVLIDFGTIRQITGTVVSGGRSTEVWSHGYTPPEQIDGRAVLQSDFYALGRTCVYLLTGIHPRHIQPDISVWRQSTRYPVSDSLVNLINRLMAFEPSRRPNNATVILRDLALIQRRLRRPGFNGRRILQRWRRIKGLVPVVFLIVLLFAFYNFYNSKTACNSFTEEYLSFGERILDKQDLQYKRDGASEVKRCNYPEAVEFFKNAWRDNQGPPDPETLIYYNNATINELNQGKIPKNKIYTIAVATPLSSNDSQTADQGRELLRGVAQAQHEAINPEAKNEKKFYLQVLIANDEDKDEQAKEIAEKLVKEKDILAVVGHFSSESTKAVLQTYKENKLVLVSPTSTSVKLKSDFFFRTVPSDQKAAENLATYLKDKAKKKKLAILSSGDSEYSKSLKEELSSVFKNSGDVVGDSKKFDLSSRQKFDPSTALKEAKKQGATAITLIPGGREKTAFDNALKVIKSDKYPDLIMVAGDSLYLERVKIETGENAVSRHLVIAIPWHRLSNPNSTFLKSAQSLWKTKDVSWRTAAAYDATNVLIEAIKKQRQPSRKGVQQVLSSKQFQVKGATGEIKFEGSDRANAESTLVTVVPKRPPASGYCFVPVNYGATCFEPTP